LIYLAELFRIFSSWDLVGIAVLHLGYNDYVSESNKELQHLIVRTLVIRSFEINSVTRFRVGGRLDQLDALIFPFL
jgi:hypothetical protein